MKPWLRKLTLTTHVGVSVAWLGAVVAYLALAIAGLTSGSPDLVRASYLSMEVIGWYTIVSLAFGALLTGLVQALGTDWGLVRHYWVATKFVLTTIATVILVKHMPTVSRVADDMRAANSDPGTARTHLLVHAAGGLVVLVAVTVLSVYKPWGRTAYGKRKQRESKPA